MGYKRQAFFNTIGVLFSLFADWLIIMVLPKMGLLETGGIYTLSMSISSIFLAVAMFATRNYQVVASYKEASESSFFSFKIYTTVISFIVCFIFVCFSSYDTKTKQAVMIYVAGQALLSYTDTYFAVLQLHDRLDIVGIVQFIMGILKLSLFFGVYHFTRNFLLSLTCECLITYTICLALTILSQVIITKRIIPFSLSISKDYIVLVKRCFPLLLATLAPTIITAWPKIQIPKFLGLEALGIYSVLTSIISLMPVVVSFLFAPLIKPFATLYNTGERDKLLFQFNRAILLFIALMIAIFLVAIFAAKWFLACYYGEGELIKHMSVFYIGLSAMCFYALACLTQPIFIVAKKNTLIGIINIVCLILCIIITPILIEKFSMTGGALTLLITYFCYFLYSIIITYLILCKKQS